MLKELYTAAMGLMTQQTKLETISNNMANVNTTGYKRGEVFERSLQDASSMFSHVPTEVEQDDPPNGTYTDFSPQPARSVKFRIRSNPYPERSDKCRARSTTSPAQSFKC
jgi:flagellar basal body rod protein FlgG